MNVEPLYPPSHVGVVCVLRTEHARLLWGSLGAVQCGGHLGSVGSVSSLLLEAGWLDQVAVPGLWYQSPAATVCCVALLFSSAPSLLSCLCHRACRHHSAHSEPFLLPFSLFPILPLHLSVPSVSQSLMNIQGSNRQADSAGFVMNGILLHIRRKCTLQCGFTNCLYCPQNDSLCTAENSSQTDRLVDTGQTDSLWYIQPADNTDSSLPVWKRHATSRYSHSLNDTWVDHMQRQTAEFKSTL